MKLSPLGKICLVFVVLLLGSALAMAQYGGGQYEILSARYGTANHNVDVTQRLKEIASQGNSFRMGNSTFGVDPDQGHVKTLRIYARGSNGQTRTFEYREGSTVDGSQFSGWSGGNWGNGGWNGENRSRCAALYGGRRQSIAHSGAA